MPSFKGTVFRGVNVLWQMEPLSGEGARRHGGRFNAMGVDCLYTSLRPETLLKEVMQGIGTIAPTTLFSYDADFSNILDLSSETRVRAEGLPWDGFSSSTWRSEMLKSGISRSQEIAKELMTAYQGILVPSFAAGATDADLNLVLWTWSDALPHRLTLNDPDDRLVALRKPTERQHLSQLPD